jgi:hypothetical protein
MYARVFSMGPPNFTYYRIRAKNPDETLTKAKERAEYRHSRTCNLEELKKLTTEDGQQLDEEKVETSLLGSPSDAEKLHLLFIKPCSTIKELKKMADSSKVCELRKKYLEEWKERNKRK